MQTKTFTYGGEHNTASRYYRTVLTLTEKSVSANKNSTVLSYSLVLYSGNTRISQWRTGAKIILNGKTYVHRDGTDYANQITLDRNASLTLCQGEITVPHNTDGTCSLSVSFSVYHPTTSSYTPGNFTYTGGSMTLTPIEKVNTVSATDAYIGSVSMVAIRQKKSGYVHSLSYEIGALSGYLTEDGLMSEKEEIFETLSVPFSIPESFYGAITDSASGSCTLTCRTYENGALVGLSQTSFTVMTRENDCAPDLTAAITDGNEKTVALTGDPSVLVRYASRADCVLSPICQKGATVGSCFIEGVAGQALSIEKTEKDIYRFALIDSRGYKTEKTVRVPFVPYVMLTANATATRPDPTNGQVILTVRGACFSGYFGEERNEITVRCALPDGREVTFSPTCQGESYYGSVLLENISHTQNHTLQIFVSDKLMSVSATAPVQKGIPVFHWGENSFSVNVPAVISGVHMGAAEVTNNRLSVYAPFGVMVCAPGVLGVADISGWQGKGSVTVTPQASGDITLSLPSGTDRVILLSPGEFTIRK